MKDLNNCDSTFVSTDVERIYTKGTKGDKGDKGDTGAQGLKGDTGVGIQSIIANEDASVTVNLTDGTTQTTAPLIDTSYSGVYESTEW